MKKMKDKTEISPRATKPCLCFLLFSLLIVLGSCGGGGGSGTTTPGTGYITDMGMRFSLPDSLFEHGIYLNDRTITERSEIIAFMANSIDFQVRNWMGMHQDMDQANLLATALKQQFVVVDNWTFPCDCSFSGLCAGSYSSDGVITTSVYLEEKGLNRPVAATVPPHTIMYANDAAKMAGNDIWMTGLWYWGELPAGAQPLPSIFTELNHAIGIPDGAELSH
jgi:hypothetical protein